MTPRAALATAVIQGAVVLLALAVAQVVRWREGRTFGTVDLVERSRSGSDLPVQRDPVIDLTSTEVVNRA